MRMVICYSPYCNRGSKNKVLKPKQILIHLTADAYGGVETHVYYLSLALVKAGMSVTLVSHRKLALNSDWTCNLIRSGVRMIQPPSLARRLPGSLALLPAQLNLMCQLKAYSFDVVIGNCHGGAFRFMKRFVKPGGLFLWYEYWYGVPTHGDSYMEYVTPQSKVFALPMRRMVEQLDGIVTGCERARQNLRTVQQVRAPIEIIPPLTQLENATEAIERMYTQDSTLRLVMVGRMGFGKGVLALLQIWQKLEIGSAELHFWGPISNEFAARIQPYSADPRIFFHGSFIRSDLAHILDAADIGLMLSIEEGYGLVAWEYMACGLPFVMTDCGAVDEFAAGNPDCIKVPVSLAGIRHGIQEMAQRVRTNQVSRSRLQALHRARFSHEKNVAAHLRFLQMPEIFLNKGYMHE